MAGTKTAKKGKGKKQAAPVTGLESLPARELYLLAKAAENAAKKLKADADNDITPGAYPVEATIRLCGDAIIGEPTPPSKGKREMVVTIGPTALLVALLVKKRPGVLDSDADLPTAALDKSIAEAVEGLRDAWSDPVKRARVQRIGEQANEALQRVAAECGFVEWQTKGAHDGRPGAVRCDPAVDVLFVSVGDRLEPEDNDDE